MKTFLAIAFATLVGASTALSQSDYIAPWAPDPLPPIDIDAVEPTYYLNYFGDAPLYPPDFAHYRYENPDAPNAGVFRLATVGTFDSFNMLLNRGQKAVGSTLLDARFLVGNADDNDTYYLGVAESIQVADDETWVVFKIRDQITWPNGDKVRPHDYIWSFEQRMEHSPGTANIYGDRVMAIQDLGDNRILYRFSPDTANTGMPLQAGLFTVLPRYFIEDPANGIDLGETFLTPLPGIGAYEVTDFKQGSFVEYSLRDDWWGFDVPALKGPYPKQYVYAYYGDQAAQREATKAGEVDYFLENSAKSWALDWENVDAIEGGALRKQTFDNPNLRSPVLIGFNQRNPLFQDRRVRKALNLTFDFELANETVFFGQYQRTQSYYTNSDMQAVGEPDGQELEILQELFDTYGEEYVPEAVFGPAFENPTTDGEGGIRANLRQALALFAEAGWTLDDNGALRNQDGEQFAFKYNYYLALSARYADPWVENMRRIGIDVEARLIDPNVWTDRFRNRDFDVLTYTATANRIGNLVYYNWASELADSLQSRNLWGVRNPAIDDIGGRALNASSREEVDLYTRVADRLLTHNYIGILRWYVPKDRTIFWNKLKQPDYRPEFGTALTGWYIDQGLEDALIGQFGYSLE